MGDRDYRAGELDHPDLWDHYSKKSDVYAIGAIIEKLVGALEVSHEM
jgi:hypothetical protein